MMPTELTYLGWSVVLLFLHIGTAAMLTAPELGLPYLAGARDEKKSPQNPQALRAMRAIANFLETYPAFVALALGLVVAGKAGGIGATGAMIYVWMRLVYIPIYVLGVPWVRTGVWGLSLVGLVMMLVRLLG